MESITETETDSNNLAAFAGTPNSVKQEIDVQVIDTSLAEEQAQSGDEIKAAAQRIYEDGEALTYMIETCQNIHVGDRDLLTSLILSFASTKVHNNKNGLHIRIGGDSGTGKTDIVNTVKKIIPNAYFPKQQAVSDKALLYNKNIIPGSVIFIDDQQMSETAAGIMKAQTSDANEPFVYGTIINGDYKELSIPERCVRWHALADPTGNEQTADRELFFFVESTKEHRKKIFEHITDVCIDPDIEEDTRPLQICKTIWGLLPPITDKRATVTIPYAKQLRCDWNESLRTLGMITSMIRAAAILATPKRTVNEKGRLEASREDFHTVAPIMNRILSGIGGSQKNKLTGKQEKILTCLKLKLTGVYPFKDLQTELKMSEPDFSKAINGLDTIHHSDGLVKIPGVRSISDNYNGRVSKSVDWNKELYFEWEGSKTYVYLADETEEDPSGCQ